MNYNNDYPPMVAPLHRSESGRLVSDDERVASCPVNWRHMGWRVSGVLIAALFLSSIAHAIFVTAVSLSPATPVPVVGSISHHVPRVVHLDLSLSPSSEDVHAAAPLLEPSTMDEPPTEDVTPAAAISTKKRARKDVEEPAQPDPIDQKEKEEEPVDQAPKPPVDSLVVHDNATDVLSNREDQEGRLQGNNQGSAERGGPTGSGNGGGAVGNTNARYRDANGTGDGLSADINGLRKSHMGRLNRAIRKRNPCTKKLAHLGLSGDVILGLTQHPDGTIDRVKVLRTSGEPMIDEAARAFILHQQDLPHPDQALVEDVWKIGLRFQCGS